MNISRIDNRLQIECDSEIETIKVFAAVLGAGIASVDTFGLWPQGMLSVLDDVAKQLGRSQLTAELCKELPPDQNAVKPT